MDMSMNNSMGTAMHWVNLNAVAPAITVQPEGGEYDGETPITLTVTATGTAPLSYQWQSSPAGAGTWSNIEGATSSTYEAAPEEDTDYRVVVSNAAGSVNSDAAAVTVASFDLEAWLETAAVYLDPEDVATRVVAGSDLVSLSSKGTKGAYLGKVASGGAVIGTLGSRAAIDSSAGVVRLDGRNAADSANLTLDDIINAGASTWVYAVSFTGSSNRVLGADAGGYLTITGNGGSSIPRATYYDTGDKASVAAGALADATPAIIVVQHDGAGNLLISVNGVAGTPIACGNIGAVTGAARFLNAFTGQAGNALLTGGSHAGGSGSGGNAIVDAGTGGISNGYVQVGSTNAAYVSIGKTGIQIYHHGRTEFQQGQSPKVSRVTGNTTLDATYHVVLVDTDGGNVTITLPATPNSANGNHFVIKNTGGSANTVTIARNGNNIDGAAADVALADGEARTLYWDATERWQTVG